MIGDELELLGTELELGTLLGTELLDGTLEGTEEDVLPLQMLPESCGTSAAPPFLSTWKPKVALWPGCKLPFQLRLLAE